jgi:ATP-binding cassette, subfamily C (CFTR/MRP), member 1
LKSNGVGYTEKRAALEQHWLNHDGRKEASLAWALNDTFGLSFWLGGLFKVSVNPGSHFVS